MKIKIIDKNGDVELQHIPLYAFFIFDEKVYIKLADKHALSLWDDGSLNFETFCFYSTKVQPVTLDPSQTLNFLLK
jgi:hypothetical protein